MFLNFIIKLRNYVQQRINNFSHLVENFYSGQCCDFNTKSVVAMCSWYEDEMMACPDDQAWAGVRTTCDGQDCSTAIKCCKVGYGKINIKCDFYIFVVDESTWIKLQKAADGMARTM